MKSYQKRIAEGRCQGYGADYEPFIKANEARSVGTASTIWDPLEGRQIHCLSTVEKNVYYMISWNPDVEHIREQFLLDTERMNAVVTELGMKKCPYYTTDFLVDYKDGSQRAFSVKASEDIFNPENRVYRGRPEKLAKLVNRQYAEKLYWESQGVPFTLVTNEDVDLILISNIQAVRSCYEEHRVTNTVQKLKYLIAHRYVAVPMNQKVLNFQELAEHAVFDIDDLYAKVLIAREVYDNER